jgi:pimeloyl-ACP methyl ester carboxylesterase
VNKIILDGHSFGGAGVAVAVAEAAPTTAAILLDPAAISRELPGYPSRIKKPVLILGADERVTPARNRDYFYRYVGSGIAEVSIKEPFTKMASFLLNPRRPRQSCKSPL